MSETQTVPLTTIQAGQKGAGSKTKPLIGFFVFLLLIVVTAFLFLNYNSTSQQEDPTTDTDNTPLVTLDYYKFGDYVLDAIDIVPSVREYPISKDLSNVYYIKENDPEGNYTAFINNTLTEAQKTQLATDQFIITEGEYKEFFPIYESNRYSYVPNFITLDSVMHTYHLMFDSILKDLEESFLSDTTKTLVSDMVDVSLEQYELYKDDLELEGALRRNIAFFSVATSLIDDTFEVPAIVSDEVNEELTLINEHTNNFAVSPVLAIAFTDPSMLDNVKEDYTQYIPRGHYTKSTELEKYFRTMMYLGRMTFLSKDRTTMLSALLITDAMAKDEALFNTWDSIYAPINFFVGKADDITYYDYKVIYDEVFPTGFTNDTTLITSFYDKVKLLPPPQINSIPIFDSTIQPDRDTEITGFRFMGQRFTVDAMIFQKLIYRDVEETADGDRKMLPSIIEVPAAMGDDTALDIIESDTDFYTFPNYDSQMSKLRTAISSITEDKWTQNLYWSWIYTLNGMVGETPSGYPGFMLTDKWQRKELNTYVSSLTELKHDTILYAKQVMAELGDSGGFEPPDDRGYVEPSLESYRRLLALVKMTSSGLVDRGLITETDEEYCRDLSDVNEKSYCNLKHLESVVTQLIEISKKELVETKLSQDEYDFIRTFGGELETMFLNTLDPEADKYSAVDDNPAMLIADVASEPMSVLEEGTGYIYNIYVIVPVDGSLRITRGAVYSHYEFSVSPSERMTNEKWREMLEDGDEPDMLKWQSELITN